MQTGHEIIDSDSLFIIDPITRNIINQKSPDKPQKISIMQYDHNSERFTFEIPKSVEGHDMEKCDTIEIHYCNTGGDRTSKNYGIYPVTDLHVVDGDGSTLQFSWLISEQATRYPGILSFAIRFICHNTDQTDGEEVQFRWNTAIHNAITVNPSMDNGETIIEEYVDILGQWEQELNERFTDYIDAHINDAAGGTKVTVGGVEQTTWDADTKVTSSTDATGSYVYTRQSGVDKTTGMLGFQSRDRSDIEGFIPKYFVDNGVGQLYTGTPSQPYSCVNLKFVEDKVSEASAAVNYTGCYDWMTNYGYTATNPCPMGFVTDVLMGQLIISSPTNSGYYNHAGGNGLVSIMFRAIYKNGNDEIITQYCPLTIDSRLLYGKPISLNFVDFVAKVTLDDYLVITKCELFNDTTGVIDYIVVDTSTEPNHNTCHICVESAYGYACYGA